MYLAKQQIQGEHHYILRESLPSEDHYIHRDLLDLGPDPTRWIHYPGGNGYYYDQSIEEVLDENGVTYHAEELDRLFFEFLKPEIQRVITGFDRSYRRPAKNHESASTRASIPVHIFDKRRFHYIRFGHSQQRYLFKIPEKVFHPLQGKSRDELEHYFNSEEHRLRHHEKGRYISTIFQLNEFTTDRTEDLLIQLDTFFIDQLCRLNSDMEFLAGEPEPNGLYPHLIKYAIDYFDFNPVPSDPSWQYIRDFIRRHRVYRPTVRTRHDIKEAEQLFEHDWKDLKRMKRVALNRIYRRQALKHHPDQGGNAETFRRLSRYYKILISKKPKGR